MDESSTTKQAEGARAGGRQWAVLVVLCVSLLVVALDNTILNVALPTLVRKLHASDSQLQWIVDGYTVVFAGLLITFGSLGDRAGRRGALLIGLVVFAAGSALSAFSSSAGELIGFRCVMGLGGALVMPATLSILTNVFTVPKERARAIGIWSGTSGLGIAIGPIIGGWLLSHFWWGSVFLVNVPIVAVGLVAVTTLVPTSKDQDARRPDPVGTVLSIAGLGTLLWGIIEAPVDGWADSAVLAALSGGAVLLAIFVVWELRSDHPMFRMDFFANARFSAASVSVSLVFFALFGAMFLLTQYLQSVLGYSPLQAGVRLAPVAVTLVVAAPLASLVVERVGTKLVVVAGLSIVAIGLGLLSRLTVNSGYLPVLVTILVAGLGMGLTLSPATEAIMGSLPQREAGVGSAMNGTDIQVGGALGVAVLGSVLNQHYRGHLAPTLAALHLPAVMAHAANSSVGGALAVAARLPAAAGPLLAGAAKASYVGGVNVADLLGMSVAIAGALTALFFLPARAAPVAPVIVPGEPGPQVLSSPTAGRGYPRRRQDYRRDVRQDAGYEAGRGAGHGEGYEAGHGGGK
jgi:EmrB/QacA subfamily drug resistance transporter